MSLPDPRESPKVRDVAREQRATRDAGSPLYTGAATSPADRLDRLAKIVASYGLWAVIMLTSPILYLGAVAIWATTVLFDRRLRVLHLYSCVWASLYTYIFPYWTVRIVGRERLRGGREAAVLCSNHQSLLDILVLFRLYSHYKWVSKAEIFRVPFIGWNMVLNNYIRIRRGDAADAERMLARCGEALETGSPVMMFPEGTRSPDGEIRAFKHGAFTLAQRHGVPVIPIVIDGTLDALPKYGLTSRQRADIVITVLDPIEPAGFASLEELRDHVRSVMIDALAGMRRERASAASRASLPTVPPAASR